MTYLIRPMQASDLAAVVAVQADAYADHFLESHAVIAERYQSSPTTAWVAEQADGVCAYLVCYCSRIGKVTPFNAGFSICAESDCLYLHDLAIAQSARGAGLAKKLVAAAIAFGQKQAMTSMGLIAVQDSKNFWEGFGFSEFAGLELEQQDNLKTYAIGDVLAFYMVKALS